MGALANILYPLYVERYKEHGKEAKIAKGRIGFSIAQTL